MKMLVYTFRTYPYISELQEMFGSPFVFGKLKEDLAKFEQLLLRDKPDIVLGIAQQRNGSSRLEKMAINKFNRGKIDKNGKDHYLLSAPEFLSDNFVISDSPTSSFCNWTAYKIAQYIWESNFETKTIFAHVRSSDLRQLEGLFK